MLLAGMLFLPVVGGHLPAAQACSCIALAPEELLKMAEVAFEGTAVRAAEPGPGSGRSDEPVTWTFDVDRTVKGSVPDPVTVATARSSASCGFSFTPGLRYRVLAYRRADGRLETGLCSGTVEAPLPSSSGDGYRLAAADGGVFAFGAAGFHGSAATLRLAAPVVGMAATPTGRGYWLVAADGGVFAFGDAPFLGSTGAIRLAAPVVGMAATPTGRGYWLVAADGGVFAFGDARFLGSAAPRRLPVPVVAIASTGTGSGYWLLAADGRILAFGTAPDDVAGFAPGGRAVALAAVPGGGLLVLGGDGNVVGLGGAPAFGGLDRRAAIAMAATPAGRGYWVATADGAVVPFGDARSHGTLAGVRLRAPVVGLAG
ncbi:MAG TPA: hypothetical protein VM264_08385 [Acidimicrobiales bacterium]|nr:hypothetical protein [Acidimicrobiales bacterium]